MKSVGLYNWTQERWEALRCNLTGAGARLYISDILQPCSWPSPLWLAWRPLQLQHWLQLSPALTVWAESCSPQKERQTSWASPEGYATPLSQLWGPGVSANLRTSHCGPGGSILLVGSTPLGLLAESSPPKSQGCWIPAVGSGASGF